MIIPLSISFVIYGQPSINIIVPIRFHKAYVSLNLFEQKQPTLQKTPLSVIGSQVVSVVLSSYLDPGNSFTWVRLQAIGKQSTAEWQPSDRAKPGLLKTSLKV